MAAAFDDEQQRTPAERRREAQRQKIIRAADDLYKQNGGDKGGFESTTVDAIAERSDISLRTFFRYFESKTDVIYLDVRVATASLEAAIRKRLKTESVTSAIFNSRLDQIQLFAANKLGRDRLLRSLNAPQFQDRLVVLRAQTKEAIIRAILPHLEGPADHRLKKARTLSAVFTELFADALDLWGRNQSLDVTGYVMECIDMLPDIVERIHKECPEITSTHANQRQN